MAEPFTIYKLTILYMLDRAGFALSNTQISNFFLELEYTDYFRVQEVIGNLVDARLIEAKSVHSATQYTLTAAGKETLGFFREKITEGIEDDVRAYFDQNKWEFRQDNAIISDYRRLRNQKYEVNCSVKNDGNTVINLTLQVGTREQAESICAHWKKASGDVYANLMDTLLK
jgi:DNA-binding PadR family transcriptional regulator